MSNKPKNPKGTRDFDPLTLQRRRYIINIIRSVFLSYGYNEIETPSIEKRSTLYQKYGSEGDKFIFNIINSGEKIRKADINSFNNEKFNDFISSISEKGLRFDLTVPLARYVSQHQNEISFPFKRFQIQNVWRADRPQKGRFQEFTQCDADVVGSNSILLEYEMLQLFSDVFKKLKLDNVRVRINHRKVLNAIAKKIGIKDNFNEFIILLDKIDKIGIENVKNEFKSKFQINNEIDKLFELIIKKSSAQNYLEVLKNDYLSENDKDLINELELLIDLIEKNKDLVEIDFDLSLARGLEYYTGLIYEVSMDSMSEIGSIGAGGRYEDLTEAFNLKDNSGIGISFGLERIYLILEKNDLFPKNITIGNDILVINFGSKYISNIAKNINQLRLAGRKIFVYPDNIKLSKQFAYSDKNDFKHVIIYGESENEKNIVKVRNMVSGKEEIFDIENFTEIFLKK
ncbi:MAG: histidine--tRNA ligase [Cryomorphaceae bacterium]|jgi:histidyl-tRNA synthetase|nr:MAG: histidine--tRNA ligase [Cryomorphaceae bacterium]|tara:strand:+ start:1130 stop:2500 length:1371 start_codon:yes stop_codon:yes gene_type:complete